VFSSFFTLVIKLESLAVNALRSWKIEPRGPGSILDGGSFSTDIGPLKIGTRMVFCGPEH
jgi:hypothetical protein